ncbi:hypothetical protein [Faecalibaculum rodentium]|jgi:molecular chaperone GrpE (heat shock protein)|uniref:Uncharacterized protein n=1 Tax=Faecalibaculum rodentium TaxID=1702221 RepID=A0A140DU56_9FIRM|nr:hypothetical protein [Faecalibaculum rodentium]AMK54183.1 hypothetical protein AALO17_10490 [Faecalibaculum rodentium]OLU46566.1 hypothetical protein BO223_01900 [Faecalibaculum rodentium]
MSDKIVVDEQKSLLDGQIDSVEEIKEHLIKAMSVLDLVVSSLEKKEAAIKDDDIASELNAIVSVYDNLDTAFGEANAVGRFLKDQQTVDTDNE